MVRTGGTEVLFRWNEVCNTREETERVVSTIGGGSSIESDNEIRP